MAQATAPVPFATRIRWNDRIKPLLIAAVLVAGAGWFGSNVLAPRVAAAQPNFLPETFASLPTGSVMLTNPDGSAALLPVRIADTGPARAAGFKGVGEQAMANAFVLYPLTRETTARTSYAVDGVATNVEFAAIDSTGTVVAIHNSVPGASRVSIVERHQYLIGAKQGTLENYGVGVGSTLDPEAIRRF